MSGQGGRWVGTGQTQEANPTRQIAAADRLDALTDYATKSETHLWLVLITHHASDAMLDAFDSPDPTHLPLLDVESMVGMPATVCMVCEQVYEPRLRRRKCPGDPS